MRAREDRGECGAWRRGQGERGGQSASRLKVTPALWQPAPVSSVQCAARGLEWVTISQSKLVQIFSRGLLFIKPPLRNYHLFSFLFLGPLMRQLPSLWVECLSQVTREGKSCITHMDQLVGGERASTRLDQSQSWERGLDWGQGRREVQISGMRSNITWGGKE